MKRSYSALLCSCAFLVGAVVMGYEIVGSRFLYPYFGGGIGTWASLISIVLLALAIGYYAGGQIVDRWQSTNLLAIATGGSALYLACVPATVDRAMDFILANFGDGPRGILLASSALLIVPLSFLGTVSPIIVRLMTHSTARVGRISGVVYAISTIGNVVGTLGTAFFLIPEIGSRTITYTFSATLAALSLIALSYNSR